MQILPCKLLQSVSQRLWTTGTATNIKIMETIQFPLLLVIIDIKV